MEVDGGIPGGIGGLPRLRLPLLKALQAGPGLPLRPIDREVFVREQAGFPVVEAENGRDALQQVAVRKPRLILLDLLMPDMDGFEFVAKLRREPGCLRIPIVVVTGKDLTADDRARLNGGVSRILQKGSDDRTDLTDEIRRLIGTRLQTGGES